MIKDLGDSFEQYESSAFPLLVRHAFQSLNKTSTRVLVTKFADQGAYVVTPDRPIRVSSIGRTFLDMLRKPDLCGGMNHVIDVFIEHAKPYLPLIINEIDRHGDKIEKVRAGYILEERCHIIENPKIDAWVVFAQRGGSRVLDPTTPYWSTFSEKWCLSINVSNYSNE
jgi:predicted transcriptional regulator of viral defense system